MEETRVGSEMLEPIDDIKLEANVKLNNKAQFSSVTGTINYMCECERGGCYVLSLI